jgi:hypothetical protein
MIFGVRQFFCACVLILMDFVFIGWKNLAPKEIKQEVLQITKDFRIPEFTLCINNTSLEHFTKNTLRHRINMKPTWETQVIGNVTVCGDASHPTTPFIGQGGAMALEDAIILAKKLHQALKSKESQISKVPESERIHKALLDFHQERHGRTYALTHKAYMVGVSTIADTTIKQSNVLCAIGFLFLGLVADETIWNILCLMLESYPLMSHNHIIRKMINLGKLERVFYYERGLELWSHHHQACSQV